MADKLVVSNWRFSFDGFLAPWLAAHSGMIPEWTGAKIHFARSNEEADALAAEGALVLNIGTGLLSGHPHDLFPDDCASTLLARKYGLDKDPRLANLLEIALVSDKMPVGKVLEGAPPEARMRAKVFMRTSMPVLIKNMHSEHPDDPLFVYNWVKEWANAELVSEKKFFDIAVPEFKQKAIKFMIGAGNAQKRAAAIRSDSDRIHKVAQSKFGGRQHLLFQMSSSGNWQIFGFNGTKVDELVALLRHAEMRKVGKVLTSDWERLKWCGNIPEVPTINYHHDGQQIFNGSLTHPDVPTTKLGFEEIGKLIEVAFNENRLEDYRRINRLR